MDDVFCIDTNTGKIFLLWVMASDPFNPPDWRYNQIEVADSMENFILNQLQIHGITIKRIESIETKKTNDVNQVHDVDKSAVGLPEILPDYSSLSVILYQLIVPGDKRTITASFTGENLLIDGYDIGKSAKEFWDDSDYVYSMTVPAAELSKLYKLLGIKPNLKTELLHKLHANYHEGDCFSKIKDLFDANNIRYEYFSWT